MNLKGVKVLVYDNGDFTFLAQRLAEDFGQVMYYTPWKSNFPRPEKAMIGEGLPGVTNVMNFSDAKKELDPKRDLIFFPDVGDGDLQNDLRAQGYKAVFGMRGAEVLEMDRHIFKKALAKLGLPIIPYKYIKGIKNLDKYLQEHEDVYVKISAYRGLMETFYVKSYEHAKSRLRYLSYHAGAYGDNLEFIVEEKLDSAVEAGTDNFIVNGDYLFNCLYGFEKKGESYVAKVIETAKAPAPLAIVLNKLRPYYKKIGPCGMFSTEVRIAEDGTPYYNDATMRGGMPPSESISVVYKNFSEVVYSTALGEKIKLEYKAPYVAQVQVHSSWAAKEAAVVEFPEDIAEFVRLRNVCMIDGTYKYIPHDGGSTLGAVVGLGNTREEACEAALERAEKIYADGIEYDKHCFDETEECIQKMEEITGDVF